MICKYCGASLSDNAMFCSKCGAKVSASKSICPDCGAENDDDQVYCEQCGSKLKPPSAPTRQDPPEPVAVKSAIGGKLKCVRLFGVGAVDVELSSDRMTVTANKLWGSPAWFRRVFGDDPVLLSDIQSIHREDERFVLTLKSGKQLIFSAGKPKAVDFFTNIQSLIETGG